MDLRSEIELRRRGRFNRYASPLGVGVFIITNFAGGCIPKRSCEFTRTCPPEGADAATGETTESIASDSNGSMADGSVRPIDASAPASDGGMDAGPRPVPVIPCSRSTNCSAELPFCDETAKVCTACLSDRDCRNADTSRCLLDPVAAQNNRCVECLTSETCEDGVCQDYACVTCNTETEEGCEGATPLCTLVKDAPTCVACEVDFDCGETSDTPTCSNNVCKACSAANPSNCAPETPVCVEGAASSRCVECTEAAHCTLQNGDAASDAVCVEEQCTRCVLGTSDGCDSSYPFCAALIPNEDGTGVTYFAPSPSDTPTAEQYLEYQHVCVECFDDNGCDGGMNPGCFDGQCVECTIDEHCKTPSASICDVATHTCVGCQALGDCAHLDSQTACDIENRVCVECTAAEDTCGEKACQTVPGAGQYTCTGVNKGQTGPCFECVGDTACLEGSNCVQDVYEGVDGGWRCLWREPNLGGGDTCPDLKVFDTRLEATSIDGAAGPFCYPNVTSCQGYRDFGVGPVSGTEGQDTCLTNEDCGLPGVDDGFCVSISANSNRCTYFCLSPQDCDNLVDCGTTVGVDETDAKVCTLSF